MGEVYLAYSPAGDPVAVKLIRADRLDPMTRARFEKEAQIARTMVGTNRVARFLDADPYADRPWLAMEYIPGQTLDAYVTAAGVLPPVLVASLGALLAEGLIAVHAAGLLHRDLKPQNIMLGQYGPVIIDFGLAAFADRSKDSLSGRGMIVGTVRCMPPEQAGGNPQVTPAADVYSLGAVLLYAATGHYPYDGEFTNVIINQVASISCDPDLSGLPALLGPLVTAMLAHDPRDRPTLETVAEICVALMIQSQTTAVRARRTLIRSTAPATAETGSSQPAMTASVEAGCADQRAHEAAARDAGEDGPASRVSGSEASRNPSGGRGAREPASARIARELRAAYALSPSL